MSIPTEHSPADVLAQLLVHLGLGSAPVVGGTQGPWPVYATLEPASPDNCITVIDTVGTKEGRTMPDGEFQSHHGVQVRLRSTNHATGYRKLRAIALELDVVYQVVVAVDDVNYQVHSVNRNAEVLSLGPDPLTARRIFTLNTLLTYVAL